MRAGLTLLCVLATLAVSSARPPLNNFGRFRQGGGVAGGSAGASGHTFAGPQGIGAGLNLHANTGIDTTGGFGSSVSVADGHSLAFQGPGGNVDTSINTNAFHHSQTGK